MTITVPTADQDPILRLVREQLESRNWSTEYLGEKAGVPGSTLRSWLNGDIEKKGIGSVATAKILEALDFEICAKHIAFKNRNRRKRTSANVSATNKKGKCKMTKTDEIVAGEPIMVGRKRLTIKEMIVTRCKERGLSPGALSKLCGGSPPERTLYRYFEKPIFQFSMMHLQNVLDVLDLAVLPKSLADKPILKTQTRTIFLRATKPVEKPSPEPIEVTSDEYWDEEDDEPTDVNSEEWTEAEKMPRKHFQAP